MFGEEKSMRTVLPAPGSVGSSLPEAARSNRCLYKVGRSILTFTYGPAAVAATMGPLGLKASATFLASCGGGAFSALAAGKQPTA